MQRIVVFCLLLLTQACQVSPQVNHTVELPDIAQYKLKSKHNVPSVESMYQLSEAQKKQLHLFVNKASISTLPKHVQAFKFLQTRLVNFDFEGENHFASESLALGQGNCMALAMLTYAVAKELGIDIHFQVMHTIPVRLDVSDKLAITSDHVRSFLYLKDEQKQKGYFNPTNRIVIDYFPDRYDRGGKLISESEFFAMFYRNLAADALVENNFDYAYLLLKQAVTLAPEYGPAINMLAVLSRKQGYQSLAEALYQYGLEVSDEKVTLLNNYHVLLVKQGRMSEAKLIKDNILLSDDQNPYIWYLQARDAIAANDFYSAKIYLKKFLKNASYYHKAYFDLAKVHFQLGEPQQAKKAISLALTHSSSTEDKDVYLAKLNWLKSLQR